MLPQPLARTILLLWVAHMVYSLRQKASKLRNRKQVAQTETVSSSGERKSKSVTKQGRLRRLYETGYYSIFYPLSFAAGLYILLQEEWSISDPHEFWNDWPLQSRSLFQRLNILTGQYSSGALLPRRVGFLHSSSASSSFPGHQEERLQRDDVASRCDDWIDRHVLRMPISPRRPRRFGRS